MEDVVLVDSFEGQLIIKDMSSSCREIIYLEIHEEAHDRSLEFNLSIDNAQKLIDTLQDLIQNAEHMND